jgi:hypothetical protein
MVREAPAQYQAKPLSEVFYLAFKSLSEDDRIAVLNRLLDDPDFREDLLDIASIMESEDEETITLEELEAELERDGLL